MSLKKGKLKVKYQELTDMYVQTIKIKIKNIFIL